MTKIVILSGGDSDERAVSLRSGAAVATALRTAGYSVEVQDPAERTPDFIEVLQSADVVFPVLHGIGGEDGSIQRELEYLGCSYVGADSTASAACFDKSAYKQRVRVQGIAVPRGEMVDYENFTRHALLRSPFVLKPNDGGSSVDTFIVRNPSSFDHSAAQAAFGRHPTMLLEELILGIEITVGVLLDEALPVIEIVPPSNEEFDYKNKYNGKTLELCPPRTVSGDVQSSARQLALRIHQLLGVRDLSRTDMMVTESGGLHVLETNTIPGMTEQSLLPKAAGVAGYTMPELCARLVDAALLRHSPKNK